jgi:hypothetical protein
MGSKYRVKLKLFSIWPDIAPPGQRMEFFGLPDSYTYSSPMLVAYGELEEHGLKVKKVAGLCFLDRQWSKDYFGKNLFVNPPELLRGNHALNMAHNWSAFHAYAPRTRDWYFVHLWRQVRRVDGAPDRQISYSGIQWSKNGLQQATIDEDRFDWSPRKYVLNKSRVLLNFAEGRDAFFPYQYSLLTEGANSSLKIEASPPLQSLDQPIYLFEGFANGSGIWDQQEVELQGRVAFLARTDLNAKKNPLRLAATRVIFNGGEKEIRSVLF